MSGKYKPSLVGIDGDLAFSKKDVWLYVTLPSVPYEFMDYQAREGIAESLSIGLESLILNNEKSVECHLIMTSVPFDDYTWSKNLHGRVKRYDPSPQWAPFFKRMSTYVHNQEFRQREVFLGICLGKRTEYKNNSVLSGMREISDALSAIMGVKDPVISDAEIRFWHERSKNYKNTVLNGALGAKEIKAETIARLLKETLWPEMELPEVSNTTKQEWGEGEITGLAIASIENNKKFLKIEQTDLYGEDQTGYRATLCFSRFPDELDFPGQEPWMHFSSLLSSPTTIYSRFTIEPANKVEKVVDRKLKEAEDQAKNSGGNAPYAIIEQIQVAHQLKYTLNRERKPWIYGRHRIVVTALTEDELRERCQEVIDLYKNLDIDVVWPTGDQLSLLMESQPADQVRVGSYYQRQEIGIIPIGMPSGSGNVGDSIKIGADGKPNGWIGPYIGRTTSRVQEPVFMSLHSAIARNNPPGLVITGAPGGGKSFAAFTLTYLMALQNVWTIFIDPKGDALPLADLPGLQGRVKKFDLKYGNDGLLDPFTLSPSPAEQKLLAIEVIKLFSGGRLEAKAESALIDCVGRVSKRASPSLLGVVQELMNYETPEGKALGGSLDIIKDLNFARLCFAPRVENREPLRADDGLTIISLQSLDLPATANRENYNTTNFLAVGIMYLLANYTESLMNSTDKSHPKAVVIDEAWAITSTPQGANMIPRLARMGRALNTALVLVSQNAGDFINLTNNMSYRMAFGTKDKEEIENVSAFFDLEKNADGKATPANAATIANLNKGECLMKDADGNIARVKIDAWDPKMFEAFDTNPETRGKKGQ